MNQPTRWGVATICLDDRGIKYWKAEIDLEDGISSLPKITLVAETFNVGTEVRIYERRLPPKAYKAYLDALEMRRKS